MPGETEGSGRAEPTSHRAAYLRRQTQGRAVSERTGQDDPFDACSVFQAEDDPLDATRRRHDLHDVGRSAPPERLDHAGVPPQIPDLIQRAPVHVESAKDPSHMGSSDANLVEPRAEGLTRHA